MFVKKSENISVGLFYKEFETPIEAVARNSTEGGITFQNAQDAQNRGAEIEFRKKNGFYPRIDGSIFCGRKIIHTSTQR